MKGMEMDTAAAIQALSDGLPVFGVGMRSKQKLLSKKRRTKVVRKRVAAIEDTGYNFEVRFVDGSNRVVLAAATFWVGS